MVEIKADTVNGHSKDANGYLPGITFPEKPETTQQPEPLDEPLSFPGPPVNGRETTVTLFTPLQLRHSPLYPSLHKIINDAFDGGHKQSGIFLVNSKRLRSDTQLFDELGSVPGTFTYIIYYSGTNDVVGTASGKRYLGRVKVVEKVDDDTARANTWKRFGPVPDGTAAWELSTMAVDPSLQRQGLAGYLMKLTEDEIRRRFTALAAEDGNNVKPTRLLTMITTIKERNFEFYRRRGFVEDYETKYGPGWFDSDNGELPTFVTSFCIPNCMEFKLT